MDDPIRIFIGTEPKTTVPYRVLCYSIRKHTTRNVQIEPLDDRFVMPPKRFGTGFSLRRWMIPEFCDFKGRAIYLDADQLVLSDIGELWDFPDHNPGPSPVWAAYTTDKHETEKPSPQSSVMVIDCERARWETRELWKKLDGTKPNYVSFMKFGWLDPKPNRLPVEWNHFNLHVPSKTRLIHYTRESTQPWYRPEHAFRETWEKYLIESVRAGALNRDEFVSSLKFPESRWQLNNYFSQYLRLFDEARSGDPNNPGTGSGA